MNLPIVTPMHNSFLTVHGIFVTIFTLICLPLGIRLARIQSPYHKVLQLVTVIGMTLMAGMATLSDEKHEEGSEEGKFSSFHSILGWVLIASLWIQVIMGWMTSSWIKFCPCSCTVPGKVKTFHRMFGVSFFPFLWIQWLSGVYHALGIDVEATFEQLLAHTFIGLAFVGMGVYYIRLKGDPRKIESIIMIIGGFILTTGEFIAEKDPLHFFKNQHIMTGLFWILCGVFGWISLNLLSSRTTEWIPIDSNIHIQSIPPRKKDNLPLSAILVVVGHILFILYHPQHLENMTTLHLVHAFFFILALGARIVNDYYATGCFLILSGISFLCAQSGICVLALYLETSVFVLVVLILGMGVLVLVHFYLFCKML